MSIRKGKECLEKALSIFHKTAWSQKRRSLVLKSLGEYVKAKEYLEKALSIRRKFGGREGEARDYGNLSLSDYAKANECHKKV